MINFKINHAVIMAAGRGIRMRPLTNNIPKAMAPLKGSTLIAKGIKEIKKYIPNIYITVGHRGPILASHVIEKGVNAVINTSNKGNAWWIFNTLINKINEPIFVLTCDNVVNLDFNKISLDYRKLKYPQCMIVPTKPVEGLKGDYIFKNKNNIITNLSRKKKSTLYCSGIQIINPYIIAKKYKTCSDFNQLWKQLISKKQIYCSNIQPTFWYAVDNIKQLNEINRF